MEEASARKWRCLLAGEGGQDSAEVGLFFRLVFSWVCIIATVIMTHWTKLNE